MSQANVELVQQAYAAWNESDIDAMLAPLHPDFEFVTSGAFLGLAPVYRGHEGFRSFWRDIREPWESLRIETDELRDAGDRVAVRFTFEGRGRDGIELRHQFANVWAFRDGLVVRIQGHADWAEALGAVGLGE